MKKQELLRAVYEAVDWAQLYEALPGLAREEVDDLFRDLGLLVEDAPEASPEPTASLAGDEVILRTDGGSRGNPGPAGIGIVIQAPSGETVLAHGAPIGKATNNVAEYRAVIEGLKMALELGAAHVQLLSDSELLVRQIQGRYRVKNAGLRPLYDEVVVLLGRFQDWNARHVPREQNAEADALATKGVKANKR